MPGKGSAPGPALYPECATPNLSGVSRHRREGTRTCANCREANRQKVASYRINRYVRGRQKVPALGSQRRIRALARVGWTQRELERRLRLPHRTLNHLLTRTEVGVDRASSIAALYRELAWQPGPHNRTRIMAQKAGWPGPMDWDDIDNPDEVPACVIDACHREALALDRHWRSKMRKREERATSAARRLEEVDPDGERAEQDVAA